MKNNTSNNSNGFTIGKKAALCCSILATAAGCWYYYPTETQNYLYQANIMWLAHRNKFAFSCPEWNIPEISPEIVAAGSILLVSSFLYFLNKLLCGSSNKRGYGSGENNRWNRRIRTERPVHVSKHYKLEHTWIYNGAGAVADYEVVKVAPNGELPESARDDFTGNVLSGHLIGRQTWKAYPANHPFKKIQDQLTYDPSVNINSGDKLLRAQMLQKNGTDPLLANPPPSRGEPSLSPKQALELGWDFFSKLQTDDGHYAGDYGGPLFLMPGLVITCHVAGIDLKERKSAMMTYLLNHQQSDGGWGLHIEGPSTVFGTAMNYTALRLMGLAPEDPVAVAARAFLHSHGGAVGVPHWGKFWLAVLGVYEWDGVNPIPPELWLLPRWFPFHPGKMWCHCRMVYLPMSYVYGIKGTAPVTEANKEMQEQLKRELYVQSYESINWDKARNTCAEIDLYAPHTTFMEIAFFFLKRWEKYAPSFLKTPLLNAGLKFAYEYVTAEDLQTNYVDIGPVNKVINMLSVFFGEGNNSDAFKRHTARIDDYLWVAEDGMKMQGYNGSQLWDTAFSMQALAVDNTLSAKHNNLISKVMSYVDASQARDDVPRRERFFRTISKGGWPFSTNDHGWPIADCTAEGMKAALAIRALHNAGVVDVGNGFSSGFGELNGGIISPQRFYDAVNVILAFHNPDGGWATYEEMRGGPWYEFLNPAEVFGDIMIDYTYTELTSACVTGLVKFRRAFPHHRVQEVSYAINRGVQYVREQQRDDGSWYGSWAVCFTYGAWFGVEALTQGGDPQGIDKESLRKSSDFLLSVQREDGGWGESYLSCLTKQYSQGESNAVNTAWALSALIHAECPDSIAIRKGIDFLIARQNGNGDWAQESVSGIFNRTCSITYTTYRNAFPLWALAAYVNDYKYRLSTPVLRSITPAPVVAPAPTPAPPALVGQEHRKTRAHTPSKSTATPAANNATASASKSVSKSRKSPGAIATPVQEIIKEAPPPSSRRGRTPPARLSPATKPDTATKATIKTATNDNNNTVAAGRKSRGLNNELKKLMTDFTETMFAESPVRKGRSSTASTRSKK